ncbi:MAG: hypothetical protein R3E88_11325 [Myxococcota bacterium]|nr:hypothetical protein [Myxococcales bacterium]
MHGASTRHRSRPTARGLAGAALLAALLLPGCGAFEELDKASAMLDKGKKTEAKAEEAPADPRRRLEWSNVKSIHGGDLEGRIVRCTVDGAVKFSSPADCRAQGGTIDAV